MSDQQLINRVIQAELSSNWTLYGSLKAEFFRRLAKDLSLGERAETAARAAGLSSF